MNDITSRWGRKFYASMVAQALTPAMINCFCRRWEKTGLTSAQADELQELFDHVAKIKPHVLPEHRESGLVFLRDRYKRKKWRDEFEQGDLDVIENNPTIQWVDTVSTYMNNGRSDTRPLYRVADGEVFFDYWMRPWQSGEHFEIMRHARYV